MQPSNNTKNQQQLPNNELINLVKTNQETDLIENIIHQKADINFYDENQNSAIHYATINGNKEIFDLLIANNALIDYSHNQSNKMLLTKAVISGNQEILDIIIKNNGVTDYCDSRSLTALEYSIIYNNNIATKTLLESGLKISDPEIFLFNILLAIKKNNYETVNYLINETNISINNYHDIISSLSLYNENKILTDLIANNSKTKFDPNLTELNPNYSNINELKDEQLEIIKDLIAESQLKLNDLKEAINLQLSNSNQEQLVINPKFMMNKFELHEINFIKSNKDLNEYYNRIQKCFNEAFTFATIISKGGIVLEEDKFSSGLQKISDLIGDIPFASLILSQIKSATVSLSKAKVRGQQVNFNNIILTSDLAESSIISELIARRFTISRQLSDDETTKITSNNNHNIQSIRSNHLNNFKNYLKEKAAKYIGKIDQNIKKGLTIDNDLSQNQLLAISDFEKAADIIINNDLTGKFATITDDKSRFESISDEIVSQTLDLPIKFVKFDPNQPNINNSQNNNDQSAALLQQVNIVISNDPHHYNHAVLFLQKQLNSFMKAQEEEKKQYEIEREKNEENRKNQEIEIKQLKEQSEQLKKQKEEYQKRFEQNKIQLETEIKELKQKATVLEQQNEEEKNKAHQTKQDHQEQINLLHNQAKKLELQKDLDRQEAQKALIRQEEMINKLNQKQDEISKSNNECKNNIKILENEYLSNKEKESQQMQNLKQQIELIKIHENDNYQRMLEITKSHEFIKGNQQKLDKLQEIADFAPDLEISINLNGKEKVLKLGDLMQNKKDHFHQLTQNFGQILSDIHCKFEEVEYKINEIEENIPSGKMNPKKNNRLKDAMLNYPVR